MRFILGILYCVVRVHATCSDCCRPGGVCDAAYKGEPGICCGGATCCPRGALCVHCEYGVTRCAHPPYTGCLHVRLYESDEGVTFILLLLFGICAFSAYLWRFHDYHSPTVSAMNVVASPPVSDGFATGLLGGMIFSNALDDHSPEPEPPSYVDVTFDSDV
jgi:hypothetical protein